MTLSLQTLLTVTQKQQKMNCEYILYQRNK